MRAFHDSRSTEYRAPYGALPLGEGVDLVLDVWEVPNATATLRTWIDNQGEGRYPMEVVERTNGGAQHTRFRANLTPDAAGTVWYQFIIADESGRETRYGAQEGRLGGEGRLADWEPPSFKLSVYDARQLEDGTAAADARSKLRESLVYFLRDESSAPDFVEAIETLREDCPPQVFAQAFDFIGATDRIHLMAQLAGIADTNDEHRASFADYGLDNGQLGLAKGRLWCACLVQALMLSELAVRAQPGARKNADAVDCAIAKWSELDLDCGDIVRNAIDLRRSLSPFEHGNTSWFAANDHVLGFWRRGTDGNSACVLVNSSLRNAHDVFLPLENDAVSEVIGGNAVPVVEEADVTGGIPAGLSRANRYARVHLYQLGTAALYFHAEQRLEKPMAPGLGVLAHITSLPSRRAGHAGTLGAGARQFVDALADAGARYWQVLPVNPTDEHGSPYAGISAFAGNALLLDDEADLTSYLRNKPDDTGAYKAFCQREADWLEPYAAFMAIREKIGPRKRWQSWPREYRSYNPALIESDDELCASAEGWRRVQFAFQAQWKALRSYANERGVQIIGDMPIYVSADSSDVWAHPDLFQLTPGGKPKMVAGCPPDAFAVEGQVWGNPLYDWDALRANGYSWWMRRLERAFDLYDIVRLDHFIGFARYYAIPSGKKATEGAYRPGPGADMFRAAFDTFGPLPIVAEDLGLITPAVRALGAACGFPGMDVVQFADGGDPLAGYNPRPNKIVYTGTHDNQTLVGYAATRYPDLNAAEVAEKLMRTTLESGAPVAIVPLQDVLGLDDAARMNVPGTCEGNWAWQAEADDIPAASARLRTLVELQR